MGFEEIFVFVVAGCVASYRQRSLHLSSDRLQVIFLWILAVALPSLAIAWITISQTSLPQILVAIAFLLCIWIYRNWSRGASLSEIANLSLTEEKQLKDCFPPAIYQLKSLEYSPQEIYCRGNLRSQNPKIAYDNINQNLQKIFGDRFVCYLKESPLKNLGSGFGGKQDNLQTDQQPPTKYEFYLTSSSDRLKSQSTFQSAAQSISGKQRRRFISLSSGLFTAFTILVVGANIHRLEDLNLTNLQQGLPYLLSLASVFVARAIALYYIAKRDKLQIDPPLLLPCLGGFGALGSLSIEFPQVQNFAKQRRTIFDLVAIPTIAGLCVSITLLILGNWILVPESSAIGDRAVSIVPNLGTFDFKNSIFTNFFQSIFQATFGLAKTSAYSPLILAGWSGLALSALQLMPFDLLDGGHLAIAMFGHHQATQIARIARLVLLAIALLVQPWLKIYSLLLFLLPTPRSLISNESIEIDRTRDFIGIILMAIALSIILPMPKSFIN